MITYTLNTHDQSNGHVTLKDLVLLDVVLYGHKVDITHWIIAKMNSIKDVVDRVIVFSTIVIVIAESLGL